MDSHLDRLARLRNNAVAAQAKADDAYAQLHAAVADALDDGVSATEVARRMGVNRVSVYRMADRGRAARRA